MWSNYESESEKRGQWSFLSGAVDLVKTQAKHAKGKLAKNNCGLIVKVKEEQWSFSSDELDNTRAKGKLAKVNVKFCESERGAIVVLIRCWRLGRRKVKIKLKNRKNEKRKQVGQWCCKLGNKKCMQSWKICESILGPIVKVKAEKEQ